jgi:hypothetical protein
MVAKLLGEQWFVDQVLPWGFRSLALLIESVQHSLPISTTAVVVRPSSPRKLLHRDHFRALLKSRKVDRVGCFCVVARAPSE